MVRGGERGGVDRLYGCARVCVFGGERSVDANATLVGGWLFRRPVIYRPSCARNSLFSNPCLVFVPPTRRGPTYFRAPGAGVPRFLSLHFRLHVRFFFPFPFRLFSFFASCLVPTLFSLSLSPFLYIHPWLEGEQALRGVGPTPPLY